MHYKFGLSSSCVTPFVAELSESGARQKHKAFNLGYGDLMVAKLVPLASQRQTASA